MKAEKFFSKIEKLGKKIQNLGVVMLIFLTTLQEASVIDHRQSTLSRLYTMAENEDELLAYDESDDEVRELYKG